jgi:hypothetical protein
MNVLPAVWHASYMHMEQVGAAMYVIPWWRCIQG